MTKKNCPLLATVTAAPESEKEGEPLWAKCLQREQDRQGQRRIVLAERLHSGPAFAGLHAWISLPVYGTAVVISGSGCHWAVPSEAPSKSVIWVGSFTEYAGEGSNDIFEALVWDWDYQLLDQMKEIPEDPAYYMGIEQ